jgi:hypothetical protein
LCLTSTNLRKITLEKAQMAPAFSKGFFLPNYHIYCNIGELVILSVYRHLTDVWHKVRILEMFLTCPPKTGSMSHAHKEKSFSRKVCRGEI